MVNLNRELTCFYYLFKSFWHLEGFSSNMRAASFFVLYIFIRGALKTMRVKSNNGASKKNKSLESLESMSKVFPRTCKFEPWISPKTSLESCLASVWELSLPKSTFQAQTHFCRPIDFQSFHFTLDISETWKGHKRVKLRYYDIVVRMNIGEMETHFLNDMIPQNFCWFAHQQILVQEWIEENSCTCLYKKCKNWPYQSTVYAICVVVQLVREDNLQHIARVIPLRP